MSEKGKVVTPAAPGLINKEDIPQVLPILPLRNSGSNNQQQEKTNALHCPFNGQTHALLILKKFFGRRLSRITALRLRRRHRRRDSMATESFRAWLWKTLAKLARHHRVD